MQFDFTLSNADFLSARRFGTSLQSSFGRLHLLRGPLLGLAWTVLIFLWANVTGRHITNWLIFLPGLFGFVYPFLFDLAGSRMYRLLQGLHSPCSVEFSEDAVSFGSNEVLTRLKWKHFTFFSEDKRNFLLFSDGKRCYSILPKSSMAPSQIAELRTLLQKHLPHK
jgi:YcxB-like protein